MQTDDTTIQAKAKVMANNVDWDLDCIKSRLFPKPAKDAVLELKRLCVDMAEVLEFQKTRIHELEKLTQHIRGSGHG